MKSRRIRTLNAETRKEYPMKIQFRYIAVILALILAGCGDSDKKTEQKSTEQPDVPIPAYVEIHRDTHDSKIKTLLELGVVVSGTITEPGLKRLLMKLYDEGNAAGNFKHHGGKPTHVFIFLFTSQEHFESGAGQWIARLSKVDLSHLNEKGEPLAMEVRTELISQLGAKPEIKHGLTESIRKEIFRASVMAEDRANEEAEQMYPLSYPQTPIRSYSKDKARAYIENYAKVRDSLTEKYDKEITKQYGITKEQLDDIVVEAFMKNWPLPPTP